MYQPGDDVLFRVCYSTMEHQEGAVLSAIEHGDLTRVGYLLNCGVITPHTLLHSPIRRESATVVGTAALEGQTDIIKYIFQVGNNFPSDRLPRYGIIHVVHNFMSDKAYQCVTLS